MFIFILNFFRSFGAGQKFGSTNRTHAREVLEELDKMIADAPKSVAPPTVVAPHTYELMVPCGHGQQIRVERTDEKASITSFVDSIKGLAFVLTGSDAANFYFLDRYFIASTQMLEFLSGYCGELEFVPITVRHEKGIPCKDEYVAVSIPPTLDCIDQSTSFGYDERLGAKDALPLSELLSKKMNAGDSKEWLAESESSGFLFPKEHRIKNISLNKNVIPDECVLFRPRHSPGFLIVSTQFANRLRFEIKGGASGYHFWTLDLNRVNESLHEHLRWYR